MKKKRTMNEDIWEFGVYVLTPSGVLKPAPWITSTACYNHYTDNLHHFIPKQDYERNKQWYEERGIKQKLILMSIPIHEQLHGQAIRNLSAEEFEARYGISKWALIFNRKYSEY